MIGENEPLSHRTLCQPENVSGQWISLLIPVSKNQNIKFCISFNKIFLTMGFMLGSLQYQSQQDML